MRGRIRWRTSAKIHPGGVPWRRGFPIEQPASLQRLQRRRAEFLSGRSGGVRRGRRSRRGLRRKR